MTRAPTVFPTATTIVAAALLGAGGCGGNAVDSGSGGTTHAGGSAQDAPCSTPGATCTPTDECCPCSYMCTGGKWDVYACGDCPPQICPPGPPPQGAACDACDELLESCTYDSCAFANSAFTASCVDEQWQVEAMPCPAPPPLPCGSGYEPCPKGALCVHPGGFGDPPYCAPNPCPAGQEVTCVCASNLCTYGYCAWANAQSVTCECPNC